MSNLTLKDLEKLQTEHPDYRMELVGGEVIVMSPEGWGGIFDIRITSRMAIAYCRSVGT